MRKSGLIFGVFSLSLASTGCWTQKQARVFIPPAPVIHRSAPDTTPVIDQAPPQIATDTSSIVPPPLPETMPDPIDAPKRTPRRAVITPQRIPSATGSTVETPATPTLGQLFTPEETREYNRTIDESLDRVKKALAIVAGKNLTAGQSELAGRIRTFQKQAEQAREQDLLTAVSLARRADLLAKDLLERLP